MVRAAAALCFVFLAASAVRAQSIPELVTDRPDQTESAVTITPGWVQFEGGVTRERYGGESAAVMARLGVVKGVEVRLAAASSLNSPSVSTVDFGGKVRLWDERGPRPEAALLAQTSIPTNGRVASGEVRLALARSLTEPLSLGSNVGAVWGNLRRRPEVLYTLTAGLALTDQTGAFVEVFGEGEWPSAAAGLMYLVRPNLQLDVSGGRALRRSGYFVGVGASYRLPR